MRVVARSVLHDDLHDAAVLWPFSAKPSSARSMWQPGTSAMVLVLVLVNNTLPYVVIAVMVTVSSTVGRRAQADAARRGATTAAPPTTPPGAHTT